MHYKVTLEPQHKIKEQQCDNLLYLFPAMAHIKGDKIKAASHTEFM